MTLITIPPPPPTGHVTLAEGNLTVGISGAWSGDNVLRIGSIKNLAFIVPDMELGPLLSQANIPTGYYAKIESGHLIFYSPIFVRGINTNLSVNVPGVTGISYNASLPHAASCLSGFNTIHTPPSSNVSIANGVITIAQSWGYPQRACIVETGNPIHEFSGIVLPDTELGALTDNLGQTTAYKVKINNNKLYYYTDDCLHKLI